MQYHRHSCCQITATIISLTLATSCGVTSNDGVSPGAATFHGRLLDTSGAPVEGARVALLVGSYPVTSEYSTDAQGEYRIEGVPVEDVREALARFEEVTLAFYSPLEDLPPFDTSEGDRVHLLPVSLDEFVEIDRIQEGADLLVQSAWVPLQARGYRLTKDLRHDGGELVWAVPDGRGGELAVSLLIAPGSIQVPEGAMQDEITLTVLDPARAPMQIPAGGFGPMWTIQPRDVSFDPPARIRIEGSRMTTIGTARPEIGESFDLYGASLEQGWSRYGTVDIVGAHDDVIVLESEEGIIRRGAWGHVFANIWSNSGVLVTCTYSGTPVACAVLDDNNTNVQSGRIAYTQQDYSNQHLEWYFTDIEQNCSDCSNNGRPESQLALGINLCKTWISGQCVDVLTTGAAVKLRAIGICPGEIAEKDPVKRAALIKQRFASFSPPASLEGWDAQSATYGVGASASFMAFDRNFSYQANIAVPAPTKCP